MPVYERFAVQVVFRDSVWWTFAHSYQQEQKRKRERAAQRAAEVYSWAATTDTPGQFPDRVNLSVVRLEAIAAGYGVAVRHGQPGTLSCGISIPASAQLPTALLVERAQHVIRRNTLAGDSRRRP